MHGADAQLIAVECSIYLPFICRCKVSFFGGGTRIKTLVFCGPDTQHPLCLVLWYVFPEEFSIITPSGTNVKIFTRSPTRLLSQPLQEPGACPLWLWTASGLSRAPESWLCAVLGVQGCARLTSIPRIPPYLGPDLCGFPYRDFGFSSLGEHCPHLAPRGAAVQR